MGTGRPMSRTNLLLSQLNSLLRLTQTEQMIATTRRPQAATSRIERDLEQNAGQCAERSELLADAIRGLGGVPDALGVAVGRASATVKATLEQGQDLDEALLGDLSLEHQLRDRARFARMLADQLGETKVVRVLDRLDRAHTQTIEWLMERLGELAIGSPPGLRPTPAQAVIGAGRRIAGFPTRRAAAAVNSSISAARATGGRAAETISTNVDRTREMVQAAGEIWSAGRDASLRRSETLADQRGARDTAASIHRARLDLGGLDSTELPIRNYDGLTASVAMRRIARLTNADDVRAILAYETANKERKGVINSATRRLETLAADLAAAS